LTNFCTVCEPQTSDLSAGTISNESNDEISISIWEDEIFLLEKSFLIQGREDGMVLICKFFVTANGIELDETWLVLPEGNSNYVSSRNDLGRDKAYDPPNIYPPKEIQVTQ